jgi:acyl-CoA thioesterase-1
MGTGNGRAAATARRGTTGNRYALRRRHFNRAVTVLSAMALILLADYGGARAEPVRLLVLGDSLAAGYGLAPEDAFPARLERRLRRDGLDVRVLNGGVSGDTSAGGRARLDWALADRPQAAIVELGANDALRGLDPAMTRANLDAVIARLKREGVRVLLAGMLAPPNFGRDYERAFNAVYPALARRHGVALYPFFLDGVATDPALNQPDGIHPNARGVAEIVDRIAPYVARLIRAGQRG